MVYDWHCSEHKPQRAYEKHYKRVKLVASGTLHKYDTRVAKRKRKPAPWSLVEYKRLVTA